MTFDSIRTAVEKYYEEIMYDFQLDARCVDLGHSECRAKLQEVREKHLSRFTDVAGLLYHLCKIEGKDDDFQEDVYMLVRGFRHDARLATRNYIDCLSVE